MELIFNEKSKKEQTHIIDGKICKNYYFHPLHNKANKKHLKEILSKKIESANISYLNKNNKIFKVRLNGEERIFSIDTMDHGGMENNQMKVEIPFANKDFKNSFLKDQLVSVINVFIPLITFKKWYVIDEDNIIFVLLNPLQIFASAIYAEITSHPNKKFSSSSRWLDFNVIYNVYKDKNEEYYRPLKARLSVSKRHYILVIHSNKFNIKKFKQFEDMDYKKQIIDWITTAEYIKKNGKSNKNLIQSIYNATQKIFRENLIKKDGRICSISNCEVKTSNILIASHIKPRSIIKRDSKLDIHAKKEQLIDHKNGFLFCIKHDAPFDKGYITIDKKGKIVFSNNKDSKEFYKKEDSMESKTFFSKSEKYLEFHRQNVFRGNYDKNLY